MRITDMHITPIALTDPPLLNAAGLHAPYALRLVLELVTDENIYGLGEIPGNVETEAALQQAREMILGQDPFRLNQIKAAINTHFGSAAEERGVAPWDQRRLVHVFSAIEVACYDIMGKVTGRSVADLLGGKVRERVPFSAHLFYKYEGAGGALEFGTDPAATGWATALDPDGIVTQAQAMCAEFGFQSIKLKGGAALLGFAAGRRPALADRRRAGPGARAVPASPAP